jgi:hypothetical protein
MALVYSPARGSGAKSCEIAGVGDDLVQKRRDFVEFGKFKRD